jgi:hypothetical protein
MHLCTYAVTPMLMFMLMLICLCLCLYAYMPLCLYVYAYMLICFYAYGLASILTVRTLMYLLVCICWYVDMY